MDWAWLVLPVVRHGEETTWRGITPKVSVCPRNRLFVLEGHRLGRVEAFLTDNDWPLGVEVGLLQGERSCQPFKLLYRRQEQACVRPTATSQERLGSVL